jgi:hypothetical protein
MLSCCEDEESLRAAALLQGMASLTMAVLMAPAASANWCQVASLASWYSCNQPNTLKVAQLTSQTPRHNKCYQQRLANKHSVNGQTVVTDERCHQAARQQQPLAPSKT